MSTQATKVNFVTKNEKYCVGGEAEQEHSSFLTLWKHTEW